MLAPEDAPGLEAVAVSDLQLTAPQDSLGWSSWQGIAFIAALTSFIALFILQNHAIRRGTASSADLAAALSLCGVMTMSFILLTFFAPAIHTPATISHDEYISLSSDALAPHMMPSETHLDRRADFDVLLLFRQHKDWLQAVPFLRVSLALRFVLLFLPVTILAPRLVQSILHIHALSSSMAKPDQPGPNSRKQTRKWRSLIFAVLFWGICSSAPMIPVTIPLFIHSNRHPNTGQVFRSFLNGLEPSDCEPVPPSDVKEHYVAHMLWPDVRVDPRTGKPTDQLYRSSQAHLEFGTGDVRYASALAASLRCSVQESAASVLTHEELAASVYPTPNVLECSCDPAVLHELGYILRPAAADSSSNVSAAGSIDALTPGSTTATAAPRPAQVPLGGEEDSMSLGQIATTTPGLTATVRCPSTRAVFEMLSRSAGPRWKWAQPTESCGNECSRICTTCDFRAERSITTLGVWMLAITCAGVFSYFAFVALVALLARGRSGPRESDRSQCVSAGCASAFVLFGAYSGAFICGCVFTVSWTKLHGLYEARVARIGNMCVSKAPNLYSGELSSNLCLTVMVANVFATAVIVLVSSKLKKAY